MDDLTRELLGRLDALETKVARIERTPAIPAFDTLADAGAFGRPGRIIYVVDEARIYRDTGAAWKASHTS